MAYRIPEEVIQSIRVQADIVRIIESYVPLKHAGKSYKACCPFHNEKTPSFMVDPDKQAWYCFGCSKGGDVVKFVMEFERVDYVPAIQILAQRLHIHIPESSASEANSEAMNIRPKLYELYERLCCWYQGNLLTPEGSQVAIYLQTRGLTGEAVEKFRIGAALDGWGETLDFLKSQGFSQEVIMASGVVSESKTKPGVYYDSFRNRLIFPIWNERNQVVAFSARKISEADTGPKYINSPETQIFSKSRTLYGFPIAKHEIQKNGAILCEGQLDVIAMHRAGFANTVAAQGTAFTDEQALMLRRQNERLYIALDSDVAGVKATLRCISIAILHNFDIRVIRFPGGKDPDDLLRNEGKDAIHAAVHGHIDFFDFLLQHASGEEATPEEPSAKGRIAEKVLTVIGKMENQIVRDAYAAKLAKCLHVNESAIVESMRRLLPDKRLTNNVANLSRGQLPAAPKSPASGSEFRVEPSQVSLPSFSGVQILHPWQKRAKLAEEELLTIILHHESAARYAETLLPHGILSDSVVGHAIEEVLQLTIEDEWHTAAEVLTRTDPNKPEAHAGLARYVMAQDSKERNDYKVRRIVFDNIMCIKENQLQNKIETAMFTYKSSIDTEERQAALKQAMEVQVELKRLLAEAKEISNKLSAQARKRDEDLTHEEHDTWVPFKPS